MLLSFKYCIVSGPTTLCVCVCVYVRVYEGYLEKNYL